MRPQHGFTRHGHAVHAKTVDHLEADTRYQRFNKKVAIGLTKNVGTMTCFWILAVMCLMALPAVLFQMGAIGKATFFVTFITGSGFYLLLTWMISTTFQALALPALLVGQNLQNEAADARAAKQFEDTETIVDRLDEHTEGGIKAVLDRIDALEARLPKRKAA